MSTRCHVELYDGEDLVVRLYHGNDGMPTFMVPKITKFLKVCYEYLVEAGQEYNWDAERVGALMILFSVEDHIEPMLPFSTNRLRQYNSDLRHLPYRPNYGLPEFQPCVERHGDAKFTYKIKLLERGKFEIDYQD